MRRTIRFCIVFLLLLPRIAVMASADVGPKPQLTVRVENPPDVYYLDLLYQGRGDYDNLREKRAIYDPAMLNALFSFTDEGWYPALAGGTIPPMHGELTGTPDGDAVRHTFSYLGVPETFRIILVRADGSVTVTEPYTRVALQSMVTLDAATGALGAPSVFSALGAQFCITFTATLLLERIWLLLFGYRLRENGKVFLLTNLATQLFLTVTVGLVFLRWGSFGAMFAVLPAEVVVFAVEIRIYKERLVAANGASAVAYAWAANLTSLFAGYFLLERMAAWRI